MLELLLIIVFLISGAAMGGAIGVNAFPEIAILLAIVGGFVGVANAYAILTAVKTARTKSKKTPTQRPPAVERLPVGTQVGFRQRMFNFLKVKESDVPESDNFKSSMPFWTVVDVCWKKTVRTAEEIRAVLLRIRKRLS
jgi:hypothetical protein